MSDVITDWLSSTRYPFLDEVRTKIDKVFRAAGFIAVFDDQYHYHSGPGLPYLAINFIVMGVPVCWNVDVPVRLLRNTAAAEQQRFLADLDAVLLAMIKICQEWTGK